MPVSPRTPSQRRHRACDLRADIAARLFDAHITVSTCMPRKLWAMGQSKWQSITKWQSSLVAILDATGGKLLKQARITQQLSDSLSLKGFRWCPDDNERATYSLRQMSRVIRKTKKNNRSPPKKLMHLQLLLERVRCEGAQKKPHTPLMDVEDDGSLGSDLDGDFPTPSTVSWNCLCLLLLLHQSSMCARRLMLRCRTHQ